MKNKIYILTAAIAFICAACSTNETISQSAVSFVSDAPTVQADSAIFRIVSRGITSDTGITIPVIFSGTAEKGTDFTTSRESFIIGGESPVDSIVVRTLLLGTEKTLSLSLDLPEGIESGHNMSSGFTLQDRFGHISFKNARTMAADTMQLDIMIQDANGKTSVATGPGEFSISIDAENSTAVEGVHFEFIDQTSFNLNSGTTTLSTRIAPLSESIEKGHDRIVLRINAGNTFYTGIKDTLEITLLNRKWAAIDGRWTADSLVTDSTFMDKYWDKAYTKLDLMPKYSPSDAMTFTLSENKVSNSFRSLFKNYFLGVSEMTKGEEISLTLADGETAELQTFMFSNTNRFFSAEETSEDTESIVGFRFVKEEEKELLDMYVIDYTSRSFMPELDTLGRYGTEKPVAAQPGMYLNLRLRK